jgi:hypothetical protein
MLIAEPYTAIPCGEIAVTGIMWSPIPAAFPPTLRQPSEVSVTKPVIYVGMALQKHLAIQVQIATSILKSPSLHRSLASSHSLLMVASGLVETLLVLVTTLSL